jgi:hypothetical protein
MKRAVGLWSVLLSLWVGKAGLAQKPPDVQMTFEEGAVVAQGLTPGKSVVWFGVEHRIDAGFSGDIAQHYKVDTVAANGTSHLELAQPAAPRSFWVAVDLDSGRLAVAGPGGYRLEKPRSLARLGAGQGAKADEILDDHPYLMGLMVRPKEGAWAFGGGDGGPRDEDGKNDGHIRFALDRLDPLPGSPAAPSKINGQDLWILVDPLTMEISTYKGGVAQ